MVITIGIVLGILTVCVVVGMIWRARKDSVPVRSSPRQAFDPQGEQLSTDPR
jgi:hypothetical protein